MRIHRIAQIDRGALENPRLSWEATGLLAYVLAHPDRQTFDLHDLVACRPDDQDSVLSALGELIRHGYVTSMPPGQEGGGV
jgi:hypothetical protein